MPSADPSPPSLSTVPLVGVAVNAALATVKILAGFFGNSYALIADGIESTADIVTSLVVWGGLRVSVAPADERHPYGYGKAEALSGIVASIALLAAAALIAVQSGRRAPGSVAIVAGHSAAIEQRSMPGSTTTP